MGDMGEMYKAMKEDSKTRRANNRDSAPKTLEGAGISFESKNYGAHLVNELNKSEEGLEALKIASDLVGSMLGSAPALLNPGKEE